VANAEAEPRRLSAANEIEEMNIEMWKMMEEDI
jgi:hypothetical protein